MTMGALPVLVAGGGIGGLSTALALARRGIRVRVLEQAAAFGEIGAGIQLAPNASRVLDALGVLEDISADAWFPDYAVMIDARDGREITRIALGAAFVARYGYRYMVVHRQDLLAALLSACRREAAIALLTGKRVGVLRDFPDRVEVSCADGSVEAGAALIGADGVWSGVRAQVIGDGAPRVSGHVCYRGTLPMAEIPDRSYANAMALWVSEAMHLVQYPMRRGELMNNVAVIDSPKFRSGVAAFGDWGEVETLFATAMPRVRDMLGYMDRERNWILHDRDPPDRLFRAWQPGACHHRPPQRGVAENPRHAEGRRIDPQRRQRARRWFARGFRARRARSFRPLGQGDSPHRSQARLGGRSVQRAAPCMR